MVTTSWVQTKEAFIDLAGIDLGSQDAVGVSPGAVTDLGERRLPDMDVRVSTSRY